MKVKYMVVGLSLILISCVTKPHFLIETYSLTHSKVDLPKEGETQIFFGREVLMEALDYQKLSYFQSISTSGAKINKGKHLVAVGIYTKIGELNWRKDHAATIEFFAKSGFRYKVVGIRPRGEHESAIFRMYEESKTTSEEVGKVIVYF